MPLHQHTTEPKDDDELSFRPQFAQHGEIGEVPRLRLAEKGMPPRTAFQIIHDELMLDGNARLNLATFVTTWMEPEAEKLMAECASKNMIRRISNQCRSHYFRQTPYSTANARRRSTNEVKRRRAKRKRKERSWQ